MLVSDIYLTLLSVTDAYLMILITDIWPPLRIETVEERARWVANAGAGLAMGSTAGESVCRRARNAQGCRSRSGEGGSNR
jgi:hypothetical protein